MILTRRSMVLVTITILTLSAFYYPLTEQLNVITTAGAEDIGFSSDGRVNDDTANTEQSAVAMAYHNNAIYLVWQDSRNGDFDIYLSKSTDGGVTWGDGSENNNDIRVDDTDRNLNFTDNATVQQYPDVAVDNSGNIYVVWQDDREGRGDDDIYFAKSMDGGATFADSVRVDHNGTGGFDQSKPCIAVDNAGSIYIAWEDERNLLNDFDIYFTNSSDSGASFNSPDVLVDDDTGLSLQQNPRLAVKETGGVPELYTVWQDERLGTTNFEVMFSRSINGGATWGDGLDNDNDKIINDDTVFVQEHPSIAFDGNGDIVVVWDDERGGSWKNIYMSKSADGGGSWSTNVKLYDTSSNNTDQIHPVIATSGNDMAVAWLDNRNGVAQTDIYFTLSNDNGATFGQFMQADLGPAGTVQSDPVIYLKNSQTVYLAWEDNRNGSSGRDIFFAKSGIIFLTAPTISNAIFTPATGSSSQEFHFTAVYTDPDEDPPASGFPKLYLFEDENGTVAYPGSPFFMNKQESPAQDFLFKNGMIYEKRLTLSSEYNYTYYVETRAETGNLTLVNTSLTKGPIIDTSNVTFSDAFPAEDIWHDHINLTFGITVTDVGAAGIDPLEVYFRWSTTGTANFNDWAISGSFNYEWLGNSLRVSLTKLFSEGDENYVQWRGSDKFGNGPAESPIYNYRIDRSSVSFSKAVPDPAKNYWHNEEQINVGVTISDTGTGVNGSTIEYSYSTAGTDLYSGWTPAGFTGISNEFVAQANLTFANGTNNYIRWRASDAMGNGPAMSEDYRIRVDTTLDDPRENHPPSAPENIKPTSTTDRTPYITWNASADEDDDEPVYHIMIGTSVNGSEFLAWTSTGDKLGYKISKNLNVGTYYVHLRSFDGRDHSLVTITKLEVTTGGNHPPEPPTELTPQFTSERRPIISWSGASDEDDDSLTYYIQIGTSAGADDILKLTWVGYQVQHEYLGVPLAHGLYVVTILAYDGFDWSEPGEFELKVAYYELALTASSPVVIKQAQSETIQLNITNNGNSNDTIMLNYSAVLAGNANMTFQLNNFKLAPGDTATADLKITVLPGAEIKDYYLRLTATSEDGAAMAEATVIITVTDPSIGPGPNGNGQDGDGDGDDDLGYPWLPNFLKGGFFWLIIVIIIILVGVAVAMSRSGKRKREAEKAEKERDRDGYRDVYGAERAPPPAAPPAQYYDEYAAQPEQQYPEEYYQGSVPPAPAYPGTVQPQQYPEEYYQEQTVVEQPSPADTVYKEGEMGEEAGEAIEETEEVVEDIEHPDTEVVPPLVEEEVVEADDVEDDIFDPETLKEKKLLDENDGSD